MPAPAHRGEAADVAARTDGADGVAFDAVFVGAATYDAIALVETYPGADERVVAECVVYAGGGPAATAAVAAARLGTRVAFVGTVGDDANGRAILEGLRHEGVDVGGVSWHATQGSAASVVVVDRTHSTRAICNQPAPDLDLTQGAAIITATPLVHVDHIGWGPVIRSGLLGPDHRLSVDAGNDIACYRHDRVDLHVPTIEALRRMHGDLSINDLLAASVAAGAATVVATDGSRGSYALTAQGESAFAPALPVEVISTLGAGDVFHGALVAAIVRRMPLAEQLAFANTAAALSCLALDGRSGIPDFDTVRGRMQRAPSDAPAARQ